MFNIKESMLIFDTTCYTQGGSLEGLLFRFYEPHSPTVRELYFATVIEAQLFALGKRAVLVMDSSRAPTRLTALDYMWVSQEGDKVEVLPALTEELKEKHRKYSLARRVRLRYKSKARELFTASVDDLADAAVKGVEKKT